MDLPQMFALLMEPYAMMQVSSPGVPNLYLTMHSDRLICTPPIFRQISKYH